VAIAARRLVILACSATKTAAAGDVAARDRYNGPLWQTLRAADPTGSRTRVAFVSAQFGFRAAETRIPNYELRLTRERAAAMIAGGISRRWPDDNAGENAGAAIARLVELAHGPFDDLALVGGWLYLCVMRSFVADFRAIGCVAEGARIREVRDSIGYMRRALREWIES
jgi:hypothetical protein